MTLATMGRAKSFTVTQKAMDVPMLRPITLENEQENRGQRRKKRRRGDGKERREGERSAERREREERREGGRGRRERRNKGGIEGRKGTAKEGGKERVNYGNCIQRQQDQGHLISTTSLPPFQRAQEL